MVEGEVCLLPIVVCVLHGHPKFLRKYQISSLSIPKLRPALVKFCLYQITAERPPLLAFRLPPCYVVVPSCYAGQ